MTGVQGLGLIGLCRLKPQQPRLFSLDDRCMEASCHGQFCLTRLEVYERLQSA